MTEDILAKLNVAHEKLAAASQAIDDFEAYVRGLREQHAKLTETLKLPSLPNF